MHPWLDERAVDVLPVVVELLGCHAGLALDEGDAEESLAGFGGRRCRRHGDGSV